MHREKKGGEEASGAASRRLAMLRARFIVESSFSPVVVASGAVSSRGRLFFFLKKSGFSRLHTSKNKQEFSVLPPLCIPDTGTVLLQVYHRSAHTRSN